MSVCPHHGYRKEKVFEDLKSSRDYIWSKGAHREWRQQGKWLKECEKRDKAHKARLKHLQRPEYLVPLKASDTDWTRKGPILTCAVCAGTKSFHNSVQSGNPHPWVPGKYKTDLLPSDKGPHDEDGISFLN